MFDFIEIFVEQTYLHTSLCIGVVLPIQSLLCVFENVIDHLKLLMSQVPYLADVLALKRHLDGAFVVGLFETWLQPSLALGP